MIDCTNNFINIKINLLSRGFPQCMTRTKTSSDVEVSLFSSLALSGNHLNERVIRCMLPDLIVKVCVHVHLCSRFW